jgi:hypothetical protein
MSYYHAKRAELAKQYLAERATQDRVQADHQLNASRAWLDEYRKQPRPSRFNWAPRWPVTPPKDIDNGKEVIEGEYTILADTFTPSQEGGERRQPEAGDETSFTSGDRTPF